MKEKKMVLFMNCFVKIFKTFVAIQENRFGTLYVRHKKSLTIYGISFYIIFAIVKVEIYANFTIAVVIFKNLISTCFR